MKFCLPPSAEAIRWPFPSGLRSWQSPVFTSQRGMRQIVKGSLKRQPISEGNWVSDRGPLLIQRGRSPKDSPIASAARLDYALLYQHSESLTRHARACRGHPRLRKPCKIKGVDGRDEPG